MRRLIYVFLLSMTVPSFALAQGAAESAEATSPRQVALTLVTSIEKQLTSAPDSRFGLIMLAAVHSSNHYGQVVEYLRMNGLAPPRTQ